MRILVVEDQPKIAGFIRSGLEEAGFAVTVSRTGEEGYELATTESFDAMILDIMLPGRDGLSVLRSLRQRHVNLPIVLLTARNELNERIEGLNLGADDYLTKPFFVEELVARLQALLRRAARPLQSHWQWGPLTLEADGGSASYGQQVLQLTPKEHLILEELLKAFGRVRSKDQLIQAAWSGLEFPGDDSVKTHIKNLRAKLSAAGAASDLVETVYGVGFRLNSTYAA